MDESTLNQPEEVLTEVTTVAKEEAKVEAKTGEAPPQLTEDEVVLRAHHSFTASTQLLMPMFEKLSAKAKTRVLASIIDLPKDGIPVKLKTNEEKQCFMLGQRAVSDRFILMHYHILDQQRERIKELKEEAKTNKTEETKEKTDGS